MLLRRHRERNQNVKRVEETIEKTIDEMTVAELKAYAEERGYDLTGVTKKPDILAKITEIELANEKAEGKGNEADDGEEEGKEPNGGDGDGTGETD